MRNLTLLTDMYELTMVGGYLENGKENQRANFDYFFRKVPDNGGYCIAAGLEQVIDYIKHIRFSPGDLAYLKSLKVFPPRMLRYLKHFRFTGDLYAVPEGTVVFPQEPIIRVTAPLPEAQFVESALLNIMNFQTLIATKASRICRAAQGDPVIEFGLRRAHGPDAALWAARAAFIGGTQATSNVLAGKIFGIPVRGTVAHSWIESFSSELEAFRAYCRVYPNQCLLLVDTYDTLQSGVPNAVTVGKELRTRGTGELKGIRLDSGNPAYLSKETRKKLDREGLRSSMIMVSGDLDEWIIDDLKKQKSRIDQWGVGTRLTTAYSTPALGGVYKLTAIEEEGRMQARIKRSDDPEKTTNPGLKKVVRFFKASGKIWGDMMFPAQESIKKGPVTGYHPIRLSPSRVYPPFYGRKELLVPIFKNGRLEYKPPDLKAIQEDCRQNLEKLGMEFKRLDNPARYPVHLSRTLRNQKKEMLKMELNAKSGLGPVWESQMGG
jgi:nicotinate phosphoribosyltransferase